MSVAMPLKSYSSILSANFIYEWPTISVINSVHFYKLAVPNALYLICVQLVVCVTPTWLLNAPLLRISVWNPYTLTLISMCRYICSIRDRFDAVVPASLPINWKARPREEWIRFRETITCQQYWNTCAFKTHNSEVCFHSTSSNESAVVFCRYLCLFVNYGILWYHRLRLRPVCWEAVSFRVRRTREQWLACAVEHYDWRPARPIRICFPTIT